MEKCRLATSKRGTEQGNAIRVRSGLKNQTALLAYNNSPVQSENKVEKCARASANVSASASAIDCIGFGEFSAAHSRTVRCRSIGRTLLFGLVSSAVHYMVWYPV